MLRTSFTILLALLATNQLSALPYDNLANRLKSGSFSRDRDGADKGLMDIRDSEEQRERLLGLEDRLNNQVFGQEHATHYTSNVIIRGISGMKEPERPWGCLLYLGPTGVGKTELAKCVARELYGDERKMLRLNMSEYSNEGGVWALIGSAPGYVNHEQGGTLSNFIAGNRSGVVLLDEIEKADPAVRRLFLHVFDEGMLSDNNGNTLDCRDFVFLMTSNLSSTTIADLYRRGYTPDEVVSELQPQLMRALTPELYNRLKAIAFNSLSPDFMQKLVWKQLNIVASNGLRTCDITLNFTDELVEYLSHYGYSDQLGARPLQRLIDDQLVTFIARSIVFDGYGPGWSITIGIDDEDLVVESAEAPPEPDPSDDDEADWNEY